MVAMVGRWWGDGGEMVGRWWGDGGSVNGIRFA